MIKNLSLFCLLSGVYGCMPGYNWVNTDYPATEMSRHFAVDKGDCIRESDRFYPDPEAVEDPDRIYDECMAVNSREDRFPVNNGDGTTEYRTVTRRANPWQCRASREHRTAYREYQSQLRAQQLSRARFVNSCMSMFGWERIENE